MRAPDKTFSRARELRRKMSLPEVVLWQALRKGRLAGLRFRRQHPIGPYILDFYCPSARLAIEVDGFAHDNAAQASHDAHRQVWLSQRGVTVLRIRATDVLRDERLEGVLVGIERAACAPSGSPGTARKRWPSGGRHLPRAAGEELHRPNSGKAIMARTLKQNADQLSLLEARVATAPSVPGIREKVKAWREDGYKGISDTTRILLNYWFYTDHRLPNGRRFAYHYFQREAVETLIYLYEVAKCAGTRTSWRPSPPEAICACCRYDDFARYCVKMATGSGKTKVMSLAIAWQFFNAVAETRDDFAKTFLLIAPNVIVFERLRTDFEGGRIFRADPVIPPELEIFWRDFQCYMRGEERAGKLAGRALPDERAAILRAAER